MTANHFVSRAPANSMILGEHSVVYGQPAIACGLEQWIEIQWTPIHTPTIEIESELGSFQTDLDNIQIDSKLKFIGHALKAFQKQLSSQQQGWQLKVHSEFSSTIGLGSSAAVLAACLAGLNHVCRTNQDFSELWHIGKKIIVDIQGRGSATDLAASLFGGLVFFQPPTKKQRLKIESISANLNLILVYCGYKTATAEVLAQVAQNWQSKPQELTKIYQKMGTITQHAYQALMHNRLSVFFLCIEQYQACMRELGVSDATLEKIIDLLNHCPNIQAAKISGSGLGDCALGIGEFFPERDDNNLLTHCPIKTELSEYLQLQLPISNQGAHLIHTMKKDIH